VLAFLAEALDEIEDEDLAEDIRSVRLENWLRRHGSGSLMSLAADILRSCARRGG
jgi:hypothetical protein